LESPLKVFNLSVAGINIQYPLKLTSAFCKSTFAIAFKCAFIALLRHSDR
jgi:hypothetical protein